jgi:hypothetical protein
MAKIAVASSLLAAAVEAGSLAQNSSQRSLLSQREGGLTSIGPPTLSGEYCGWSPHGDGYACRLTFSGDTMRLEWRKDGNKKLHPPCKGPPKEHQNCLGGIKRRLDCKNEGYKVVDWCEGKEGVCYDVEWTSAGDKSDCIRKAMGASTGSPTHVPLRIKVHDGSHLNLIEGKTQDGKLPDGISCNAIHRPNLPDGTSGCDGWNNHSHKPPCRRRAGCKSSGLPIPYREDANEEYDDEEFDLDDVLAEVV